MKWRACRLGEYKPPSIISMLKIDPETLQVKTTAARPKTQAAS